MIYKKNDCLKVTSKYLIGIFDKNQQYFVFQLDSCKVMLMDNVKEDLQTYFDYMEFINVIIQLFNKT